MSRGLSAAAKAYQGPIYWAAKITLADGAIHYLAQDDITFLGTAYKKYLGRVGPVRLTRSVEADAGELELLNADLFIGGLLEAGSFENAQCQLSQLLLGIDEKVDIIVGRLTEQAETDELATFRIVSDMDAAGQPIPTRNYAPLCSWWFAQGSCAYDPDNADFTENLGERTANIFSLTSIGDSALAMTVDEHKDRWAVILAGTGKGQKRLIRSNTATVLTLYGTWKTVPTGTSTFKVFTFPRGAPKILFTSTSGKLETTATSGAANFIEDTGLSMTTDEHKGDWVRIESGTGAGQRRKIGSNTGARLTLAATEPGFSPPPDATSVFRVVFARCPKDVGDSCENRARNQDFNGFPTITAETSVLIDSIPGGDALGGRQDPGERLGGRLGPATF